MKQSTRDYTYEVLKEKILTLEIEPGKKISEKDMSQKLGVSRTPIREAFLKLAQEELLEIYPQRGTFVSLIDLDHVEEARFMRESVERAIVRLACSTFTKEQLFELETNITMQEMCVKRDNYSTLLELDEEFHKILFAGCSKMRVWETIQQMNNHFIRLRVLRVGSNLNWNVIVSQHKAIFDRITNKEEAEAEQAMADHLQLVAIEKNTLMDAYPDYFK
ncbi:GntR family transcriptional regulator [Halobacillus salinarum]|uniref:GntR family transcriptional regulator n=1 Tax=Halobacillus salinarum TaxID=2932257 RepID=A0ABY4EQA4_9BACI|nr:GntR family transcriptional regulator [Halobacillus salinarum]UOQ46545.1 GntR family transcriptional regulator [Halobacillus salinarum]